MLEAIGLLFCGYVFFQAVVTLCNLSEGGSMGKLGPAAQVFAVTTGVAVAVGACIAAVVIWQSGEAVSQTLKALVEPHWP